MQVETANLRRRDVDVIRGSHVAGIGRTQKAKAVGQYFKYAIPENLFTGFRAFFQDGEHQFLFAQTGRVVDVEADGHFQQSGNVECL